MPFNFVKYETFLDHTWKSRQLQAFVSYFLSSNKTSFRNVLLDLIISYLWKFSWGLNTRLTFTNFVFIVNSTFVTLLSKSLLCFYFPFSLWRHFHVKRHVCVWQWVENIIWFCNVIIWFHINRKLNKYNEWVLRWLYKEMPYVDITLC